MAGSLIAEKRTLEVPVDEELSLELLEEVLVGVAAAVEIEGAVASAVEVSPSICLYAR